MANLVPKIPPAAWVDAARDALLADGIDGVRVDRLAKALGVTRGGFYHHFADRGALLDALLAHWEASVVFVDPAHAPADPAQALAALDALVARLIGEHGYDPRFDLAVRAWSQSDARAARAVRRVDRRRLALLERLFVALGCSADEADVRACVFYFHQIGYYAIGIDESAARRRGRAATYLRILCGEAHLDAARRWSAAHAQAPAEPKRSTATRIPPAASAAPRSSPGAARRRPSNANPRRPAP
jgi:AcrR family transcriptional regulator